MRRTHAVMASIRHCIANFAAKPHMEFRLGSAKSNIAKDTVTSNGSINSITEK
jgi:hypothetical protein